MQLVTAAPADPEARHLYGDALWAAGSLRGGGRSVSRTRWRSRPTSRAAITAWRGRSRRRSQLDEAMNEAQTALRLSPRDLEIHHTVGAIYERMHKYEEAAAAFTNYVNLLPNKDTSDKAGVVARGNQVPAVVRPARAVRDGSRHRGRDLHRRFPAGERQGGGARQGQRRSCRRTSSSTPARRTRCISRPTAQRLGITPITYTLSAGVGDDRAARAAAGAHRLARARHARSCATCRA